MQLVKISILLLIGIFCLSSCQKDGVFNPKKKISKISIQIEGEKEIVVTEVWTWDKDKLMGNGYAKFEYDGEQLSKIVLNPYTYTKCIYKGNKLDKMETYSTYGSYNTLVSANIFEYKGSKMSKIIVEDYSPNNKSTEVKTINPLQFVLPQQLSEGIMEHIQMEKDEKGTSSYTISLTWNKDNIEKMVTEKKSNGTLITQTKAYTYDNKKNPFYGLLYPNPTSSKNNVIKETSTSSEGKTQYTESVYSYTYKDNYPIERKTTINTAIGPYTLIQYYEYLK